MDEDEKKKLTDKLALFRKRMEHFEAVTGLLNFLLSNGMANARSDLEINAIRESDDANTIDQAKSDITFARNKMRGLHFKYINEVERLERELDG